MWEKLIERANLMTDCDTIEIALSQFGLPSKLDNRAAIIAAIEYQIRLEEDEIGDQFLMRLLCAQLFSIGLVEDSILIWRAKSCNFDTYLGIDVQFLCGAGLEHTKEYLHRDGSDRALEALDYIADCESDFLKFNIESVIRCACEYYKVA
jgi:hypothetical protein